MSQLDPDRPSYQMLVAVPPPGVVSTRTLFQPAEETNLSPIDVFIHNTNRLNTIYLPYSDRETENPGDGSPTWIPEIGNLILLGYMSAVESYVRALITGLINVDAASRRLVGDRQISFALVAAGHNIKLLPEVLLEHQTFSTEGKIEEALKTFVGIQKFSADVARLDVEFKKLCQIRHCCVHRFGKLGSQNAWKLGFDEHRDVIEQPFSPTRREIENIASIIQAFVKTLNNFVFRQVLDRTLDPSAEVRWTWDADTDRDAFHSYYDLFAIKGFAPRSASAEDIYSSFKSIGERATGRRRGS